MMKLRSTFADWRAWLVWIGPTLLAVGFLTERMWRSLPAARALETLLISFLALTIGFVASRLLRVTLATSIACLFVVAAIWFIGFLPVLGVLLFSAAALSVGYAVARDRGHTLSIIVGVSLISATVGWLLPFPLHYRFIYFLLFIVIAARSRRRLVTVTVDFANAWRSAARESPRLFAFAVLVVGLASTVCWLPTVQFDDLAYHLGLPAQLSELHYYRMDVQSQIWALAPWSGDIVQAIAQILANGESRGAVDALWLLLIGALTWNLTTCLSAQASARYFAVALVASQPLTASLVGGMQAELPATAATLALALSVLQSKRPPNFRDAATFAIIAGFLLALKTGFIAIVVPLAIWSWCRTRWTPRLFVAGLIIMPIVCGSSYMYATLTTGDPFFPLFSDLFHAHYAANVMNDSRWMAPIGASIPWGLTFHTDQFFEGWDGAAGFSMLGLIGAAIVALFARSTRWLAACGIFAFLAVISTVHYFRYAYPALILLLPATVVAFAAFAPTRASIILLSSLIVLNLAYQSTANWTLHVGGVKHRLIHRNPVAETERYAPTRSLVRIARDRNPEAIVLFSSPEEPFAAEMAGRGLTVSHYDPELEQARLLADGDVTGASWRAIFERTNAQYAIVSRKDSDASAITKALGDAQMIREIGSDQLWQLSTNKNASVDLVRARDLAREKFWP
jgi:hypothetical protein